MDCPDEGGKENAPPLRTGKGRKGHTGGKNRMKGEVGTRCFPAREGEKTGLIFSLKHQEKRAEKARGGKRGGV